MKILCTYKPTEQPWGGANTFLRALYSEWEKSGAELTFDRDSNDFDILFMNQLSIGRGNGGGYLSIPDVEALRAKNPQAPLIVRLVNLRHHSNPSLLYRFKADYSKDRDTIELANMADHVIFQSHYQKGFFENKGASPKNWTVIHNGASESFLDFNRTPPELPNDAKMVIISSSFSKRATKRHDLISRLSLCEKAEIHHMGAWPDNIPVNNVDLCGVLEHEDMLSLFKKAHYFLHPAVKDPCPNSMIEALCAGLPVIYNPGIGSGTELGKDYGIALNEKNLDETLSSARTQYDRLIEKLQKDRSGFSINHVAKSYLDVFQSCLKDK